MKDLEYNLEFKDVIDILLDGGAVKGEYFTDGVYLKLSRWGKLVIVDACRMYEESDKVYLNSLCRQKYRELTVMTVKELSK